LARRQSARRSRLHCCGRVQDAKARKTTRFFPMAERKPGVLDPADLQNFVTNAGANLIVIDVRNPDFAVDQYDVKTNEKAPIADCGGARARAVNVVFDRGSNSLDLSSIPQAWIEAGGGKATVPVITHCGGGGRGQKAKEFLEANGFGNVVNGGGPEDDECWQVFGSK